MNQIEVRRYGKTMIVAIWKSREIYIGSAAARALGHPHRVAIGISPDREEIEISATDAPDGFACRRAGGQGMAFTADSILRVWDETFGYSPAPGKYRAILRDEGPVLIAKLDAPALPAWPTPPQTPHDRLRPEDHGAQQDRRSDKSDERECL